MAAPEQVTIGAKHTKNNRELIASLTQVTTHTQNSTDTYTLKFYEKENGGERGGDYGNGTIYSPENLG